MGQNALLLWPSYKLEYTKVIRKKNSQESQEISILGIKGKSEPGGKRFLYKENSRLRLMKREGEVTWKGKNKNWFKMNWKTRCMNRSDRTKGRN